VMDAARSLPGDGGIICSLGMLQGLDAGVNKVRLLERSPKD
jgi:hypothetical protein